MSSEASDLLRFYQTRPLANTLAARIARRIPQLNEMLYSMPLPTGALWTPHEPFIVVCADGAHDDLAATATRYLHSREFDDYKAFLEHPLDLPVHMGLYVILMTPTQRALREHVINFHYEHARREDTSCLWLDGQFIPQQQPSEKPVRELRFQAAR